MILNPKKISKSFWTIIIILIVIFAVSWFFWPKIKKLILGSEYQAISTPLSGTIVDKNLKQKIISELEKLRQYGEWPISISSENPNRGDPFKLKQQ